MTVFLDNNVLFNLAQIFSYSWIHRKHMKKSCSRGAKIAAWNTGGILIKSVGTIVDFMLDAKMNFGGIPAVFLWRVCAPKPTEKSQCKGYVLMKISYIQLCGEFVLLSTPNEILQNSLWDLTSRHRGGKFKLWIKEQISRYNSRLFSWPNYEIYWKKITLPTALSLFHLKRIALCRIFRFFSHQYCSRRGCLNWMSFDEEMQKKCTIHYWVY